MCGGSGGNNFTMNSGRPDGRACTKLNTTFLTIVTLKFFDLFGPGGPTQGGGISGGRGLGGTLGLTTVLPVTFGLNGSMSSELTISETGGR